jgi:HTH-type transcriptional regulator, glycine betaine synthesis regulator
MLVSRMRQDIEVEPLTRLEVESIEYFISFVQVLGLPKSVGEIYGLLFAAPQAISMDTVIARLRISKGSASQGLAVLRNLGAVEQVYVPGDRRDHYRPDFDLHRIVGRFFRDKLEPRLQSGMARLERMEDVAGGSGDGVSNRVRALRKWHAKGADLLPMLLSLLDD